MTVRLDIFVDDVYGLLSSGYDEIKVYRSTRELTDYSEVTAFGTRLPLLEGVGRYSYTDVFGNADSWYRWSYYDVDAPSESSLSEAARGTVSGSSYRGASYPAESYLSSVEQSAVLRVRQLIGDPKTINRDYISSATSYDNVSQDGYSVELDNPKGWPLSVSIDGVPFTTINDPVVRGYQFVTFSGTQISTVSGTVDIWYESFRFSDAEILEAYTSVDPPIGLSAAQSTAEMYEIQTAIRLLESELRGFMATSSSKVSIYEEISIDPSSGLVARQKDLEALRKRMKDLVTATTSNNLTIFGVRID